MPPAAGADSPARMSFLVAGAILGFSTLLLSGGNAFRTSTLLAWGGSVLCLLVAFWEGESFLGRWRRSLGQWIAAPRLSLRLDGWSLLAIVALEFGAFFRFYLLDHVPPEMWSDHAEKLLDVMDVLNGSSPIFFLRNTGREPIQFYLSAGIARWAGTGLTFLTLKLGTAAAGFLTLPFLYLIGRQIGGKPVAVAALALAGIGFWPNLIARTGLRFALLPVLAAPALYFLIRGLERQRRNDVLLAGLFAGAGLYGYSPARIVPVLLILGVAVFASHPVARGRRKQVFTWLAAAALIALAVFLPLLHAGLSYPEQFLERSLSRMTAAERPLPGSTAALVAGNLWSALKMFNWDSGRIWVVTLPGKPALDWVTGGLFLIGVGLFLARYLRRRSWLDLFLLLSIPLLLAPSFLSLAFPEENPAPNRASAAMIPVFVMAGFGLVSMARSLRRIVAGRWGALLAGSIALALTFQAARNNYRMLFVEYSAVFRQSSWNTLDAGRVVRGFAESVGSHATAHVVPYPHWFDTRLVAFQAGRPGVDMALHPEEIDSLAGEIRPQLFLVNLADLETLGKLNRLFPQGWAERFVSGVDLHDFWIFFVPARGLGQ